MNRLTLAALALLLALPLAAEQLGNSTLSLTFDPAQSYALTEIGHRAGDFNYAASAPKLNRSPWLLTLRKPDGNGIVLSTADALAAQGSLTPGRFTAVWTGVGSKQGANLTVTATVSLLPSGAAAWRLAVSGAGPGALWQIEYPRLALRPVGEDILATPVYLGRLRQDPVKTPTRFGASYPSPLSMQFMATYGTPDKREPAAAAIAEGSSESGWTMPRPDALGLLWAAADRAFYYKQFTYDTASVPGVLQASVAHYPSIARWPLPQQASFSTDYQMPYPVVLQAFTGDAHEACRLYRALDLAGPSQKPANPDLAYGTPNWFRSVGFWAKFYHEPSKIVPEWAAYAKWLRVPIASHYYRGPIAVFDDNYPEMLPVDPYYVSGVRDAKDMGVFPMPYTNGVIWDQDTQSYIKENGSAGAIKDEAGNIPIWDINREWYAYMCPGTKQWQNEVGETAYRQIVEHGMSGVYLDCLTATRSYMCYDPQHGHTLHGGNYYAQGQRTMMHEMRLQQRRVDPGASYFPEECGEWLIDLMDGYLTLDISRSHPPTGERVFPLFNLAYHPDTITFGCDGQLSYDPSRYAWEMGHMFVWGSQPLHSDNLARDPKEGDPNSEMLRELVQAYYVAGQPFLCNGQAVPAATRPLGTAPAAEAVTVASAPYRVEYTLWNRAKRTWNGPAVLASAWRRGGDIAIVMCNISDREQQAELTLRPELLGVKPETKLLQTWPREPQMLGAITPTRSLTIPGRKVRILVLTADPARASVGRELLATPWELLTTTDDKPFEPLRGQSDSLWACSDGPVANTLAAAGTSALPMKWDAEGKLAVRTGIRPKLPEGAALPRETDRKPFALLRKLPVRAQGTGVVEVLSGDDSHLLCRAGGGVTLSFVRPGLLIASDAQGKTVAPLAKSPSQQITLPAGGTYVVGYARLDDGNELVRSLQTADAASRAQAATLQQLALSLRRQPTEATLAKLSVALAALQTDLGELPGAFVPGTPLEHLTRQITALVSAQLATTPLLLGEHDWLAPGVPYEATFRLAGVAPLKLPLEASLIGSFTDYGTSHSALSAQSAMVRAELREMEYVMRLVPLLCTAQVSKGGQAYALGASLLLDSNRPFELQGQPLPATSVAGRQATADFTLRKWSPYPLQAWLKAEAPAGWQVKLPAQPVSLPELKNTPLKLQLSPPANARGLATVRLRAGYTRRADEEGSIALIQVNVQPLLVPLQPQVAQWTPPSPAENAHIRNDGRFVLYANAGDDISLKLDNVRVTTYTNTLTYKLLDPDLTPLKEGRIVVDKSDTLVLKAPATGAYFLEVVPMQGSTVVTSNVRVFAESASPGAPLKLFCSSLTRHFYVPAGAKQFKLGAKDGGPDEGAKFIVTSPTGRVAYEFDGNYGGAEAPIEVRPDEAGKVWKLRVEPKQDLTFWLSGDVSPYLSTSPERVVIEGR